MHKRPKIVPTSTGIRFGPTTAEKPSDDRWEVVIEGRGGPPLFFAMGSGRVALAVSTPNRLDRLYGGDALRCRGTWSGCVLCVLRVQLSPGVRTEEEARP
ncbi:hypothetical protein NDU88_003529 [Pleurodeles waltl]|uniref:Uncharacterized protein n=1 Tax=Pleurodeles waltl TaxID=8319 RepID=A0AAV7MQV4_PLEWA|nr:hypothetical protein NDU88_003529 [Pleurodeles waltl]